MPLVPAGSNGAPEYSRKPVEREQFSGGRNRAIDAEADARRRHLHARVRHLEQSVGDGQPPSRRNLDDALAERDLRGAAVQPKRHVGIADRRQSRHRAQRRRGADDLDRQALLGHRRAGRLHLGNRGIGRDVEAFDVAADDVLDHPIANLGRDKSRPQPLERGGRHRVAGNPNCKARLAAVIEFAGHRDGDAVASTAAAILGSQVALLQRDPLLDRIDVAAHDHALEHQRLVVGGQRIEHDPSAAEREHPVAAGQRGRGKFGAQGEARRSRRDLERHAQRSPRGIPVQPELGAGDRNLMFGIVRTADRTALRIDRAGQRLRRAVRRDVGVDRGRDQRIGTELGFRHAQGQQVVEHDLARFKLQAAVALRSRRQCRAHRPGPLLALRQDGQRHASRLRPVQVQTDLGEFPLGAAAAVVNGEAAIGDADFVQRLTVEAAGAGIKSELAKLVDPGEQRRDIARNTAPGHRLQREHARAVRRRLAGSGRTRRRLVRGSWSRGPARRLRLIQLRLASLRRDRDERPLAADQDIDLPIRIDADRHIGIDQAEAFGARACEQQARSGNSDLGLGRDRDGRAGGIAQHDVAETQCGAALFVALKLRAADLRRDSGCRDSARSPRSATA